MIPVRLLAVSVLAVLAAKPAHADRMALWTIVHGQCVPAAEAKTPLPRPCLSVHLDGGEARGDAVIKDLRGVAQVLDIPSARVTGIEDPAVLKDDAPDYFADAWRARADMAPLLKAAPSREALSIAVNSKLRRSQDQMHFHVDCLKPDIARALAEIAPKLDGQWRQLTEELAGRRYWARRVDGADLDGAFPFRSLADGVPGAKDDMGRWSLAAAAVQVDGRPAFVLLADPADLLSGGHSEDLQDLDCAIVH